MLRVDLAAFFGMVARMGRDPALLLLTIRALRQRSSLLRVHDLAWMLGTSPARLRTWLERLSADGALVYDLANGTIEVEVPVSTPPAWAELQPPHLAIRHELPTHWFIHVLPRIGRTAFVVYLYLLMRDGLRMPSTLSLVALVRAADLRGAIAARWHLWRLRRFGLLRLDTAGALVLRDPPPLTPAARWRLRSLRKYGAGVRWLGRVGIVLLLLLAALVLVAHFHPAP